MTWRGISGGIFTLLRPYWLCACCTPGDWETVGRPPDLLAVPGHVAQVTVWPMGRGGGGGVSLRKLYIGDSHCVYRAVHPDGSMCSGRDGSFCNSIIKSEHLVLSNFGLVTRLVTVTDTFLSDFLRVRKYLR